MIGGKNTGFGVKPKALMCCICGREFGTSSLEIHMKQCEKKNNYKIKIPDNYFYIFDKIKSGEKLSEEDYELFNQKANDDFKEKALCACPNCGRKFFEDRLTVHLRSCKGDSFSSPQVNKIKKVSIKQDISNTNSTNLLEQKLNAQLGNMNLDGKFDNKSNPLSKSCNPTPKPSGPIFLVCYVCGKEFGKHSIEIHLEKCMEKHYKEELNKGVPKKQIKTPNPPEELLLILDKVHNKEEPSYEEIQEYNCIGREMFTDIMMKQCLKCGRKFNSDRLEVHLKSCNPDQLDGNKGPNMSSKPRMHMCPLCGKEFGSLSLDIHMKTCKDKFDREQLQLPFKMRKTAESVIEKFKAMEEMVKGNGEYDIDKMNVETFKVFNEEALVPCDLCGRTFLPDRLQVHLRSCKGPKKK